MKPILIYSQFALGKTSFIGQLIRELLTKHGGEKARVYCAETYSSLQSAIDEGVAEVWQFNERDYPFETLGFAADGFWPSGSENGVAVPNSKLVAPTAETFRKYPIRIYEGIESAGQYMTGDYVKGGMSQRIGAGEYLGSPDSKDMPIKLIDGETEVGGLSRSNIYFAQQRLMDVLVRSIRKPGYTIWTTQEDDAKDRKGVVQAGGQTRADYTGPTVIGPQGVGNKMTLTMGKQFGDLWRIVSLTTEYDTPEGRRGVIERRLYLKEHICPVTGLMAKGRNSGGLERQHEIPDYITLTEKGGNPRMEAAAKVVERLKL